jgi:hypothetical protein
MPEHVALATDEPICRITVREHNANHLDARELAPMRVFDGVDQPHACVQPAIARHHRPIVAVGATRDELATIAQLRAVSEVPRQCAPWARVRLT